MERATTNVEKGTPSENNNKDWVYFANPVVKMTYSSPIEEDPNFETEEKEKEAELNIQKRRKSDVLKKLHYCGNKDFQKNIIHLSDLQSTIETTKQQLNNIAQTMISTINESIEKKNKIKLLYKFFLLIA